MADTFKKFGPNDSAHVRNLIHENVPIAGAIAWSAYGTYPLNTNVNFLAHGMFQSVYDYTYTNSSANQIFDLSLGVHADSSAFHVAPLNPAAPYSTLYNATYDANGYKRKQIYNALAQRLCGIGTDGSVLKFDRDGDFSGGGEKYEEVIAILLTRLLHKDGIKPGSFSFNVALHPYGYGGVGVNSHFPDDTWFWDAATETDSVVTISDVGAATSYRTNSPAGRFAVLYATQPAASVVLYPALLDGDNKVSVGLIFYDAGIVILTPWLFLGYDGAGTAATDGFLNNVSAGVTSPPTNSTAMMLYNATGGGNYTTTPPADPQTYTEVFVGTGLDDVTYSGSFLNDYFRVAVRIKTTAASPDTFEYSINGGPYAGDVDCAIAPTAIGATEISVSFAAIDGHLIGDYWTYGLDSSTYLTMTELVRGYEENPALPAGDVNLTIGKFCDAFRQRISSIAFLNTTELNSTVYFCRVNHDEFNYSSNPTYCDGSRIVNKSTSQDPATSYITTVGLYSSDGALLAVAKASEPFKKVSGNELNLSVRLDY